MHILDGYLGPQTYIVTYAVMTPVWVVAARRLSKALTGARAPLLGLAAAFSFVVMMINIPIPGGTTGHATGAALIAILLGPAAAIVSLTVALAVQALAFGDGGITAFAANCINIAFVMPLTAYGAFRLIAGKAPAGSTRRLVAGAVAGYVSLNVAALATAVMFGIQPLVAHNAAGKPLYSPYGLQVTIPAMMFGHLLLFGFAEAAVTALALRFLEGSSTAWQPSFQTQENTVTPTQPVYVRWLKAIAVLLILSPLGILLPAWLGAESAWGEWSAAEIGKMTGFMPAGMAALADRWKAPLPDYALPWQGEAAGWLVLMYIISAVVGITIILVVGWGFNRLFDRTHRHSSAAKG